MNTSNILPLIAECLIVWRQPELLQMLCLISIRTDSSLKPSVSPSSSSQQHFYISASSNSLVLLKHSQNFTPAHRYRVLLTGRVFQIILGSLVVLLKKNRYEWKTLDKPKICQRRLFCKKLFFVCVCWMKVDLSVTAEMKGWTIMFLS